MSLWKKRRRIFCRFYAGGTDYYDCRIQIGRKRNDGECGYELYAINKKF